MHRVESSRFVGSVTRALGGIALVSLLVVFSPGGCPLPPSDSDVPPADTNGNDTFATATQIVLGDDDETEFTGSIGTTKDTDIFKLGALAPGDRLFVDVQTTSGGLDPVAAVFDQREYVHAFNDDRTPDASNLNPLIDVIVRGPEGPYYLGVAPFPDSDLTGDYRVILRVTRGVGVPDPEPQVVYLDWEGGPDIDIENVGTYDLAPFDAAQLGPTFAGQTEALEDRVQQEVADRYEDFNFVLLNSDDHPEPATPHSTVYFGGKNPSAFAIAQQIDTHNADADDDAIIFTTSFRNAFSGTPTLTEMATALANTISHEVGHLLGLIHTKDCDSLMDSTCSNDSILVEQAFKLAPLDDSVFPVGYQNAVELIGWMLGLAGL